MRRRRFQCKDAEQRERHDSKGDELESDYSQWRARSIKNTGTTGAPVWTDPISLDSNGNALFGGVLSISSGSTVVKADGSTGLWVGASAFSNAPFRVDLNGRITASNVELKGGSIGWGNFNVNSAGVITATGASISGNITANALTVGAFIQAPNIIGGTITGNEIKGGTITGTTISSTSVVNVATDVNIGNNLYIGDGQNVDKYIYFKGSTIGGARIRFSQSTDKLILFALNGVEIPARDLTISGNPVATEEYVRQYGC